jgi:acyl-CoA synthetase (AMP-forming)/AMP-acid ligase II
MNLMMLLEMAASGHGERVAVQCDGEVLRYEDLFAASGAAARELQASGAAHLALLDVASLAAPVALFAAARAGVPYVPLNYRLTGGELDALLERIAPAQLVTDAARAASFSARAGASVAARAGGSVAARDAFLERARAAGDAPAWPDDAEGIAVLLFTSGTTGAPKAAVLRHRHLVSYVLGSVEFASAGEDEAALVSVPPYHVAGVAAILSSVYAGRRIVQLPSFSPEAWLAAARAERVTHAFVVPTMLARIVDALAGGARADLPQLRSLSYGGGKMPLPVIERALELFPETEFTNAYGLTETSSTIALLGPELHRKAATSGDAAVRRRLASVGRALPGVEIEVRDEEGKPLATGAPGEVYVRGPQVSGEYVGRGSQLGADGWLATRDGGFLDEEGYLFLQGRIDDVIVRGGENLSPGEIEDVLLDHPSVAECAVVGIADVEWGEAVAAAVVLAEGASVSEDELQAWVRARLRSSRVPSRVVFRRELPYNETGKLLRRVLRAELAEGTR